MSHFAKITSKGQTTIPAEIRALLGVGPGDRLEYDLRPDGRVEIRKAPHPLEGLRGLIKVDRPISTEEIVRWVREMRDGTGWLDDRD